MDTDDGGGGMQKWLSYMRKKPKATGAKMVHYVNGWDGLVFTVFLGSGVHPENDSDGLLLFCLPSSEFYKRNLMRIRTIRKKNSL